MIRMVVAFSILVATLIGAQAQTLVPSTWVNQRTSVMSLDTWDASTKMLKGRYVNNAPGFKHCAGTEYELWGASDGKKISFNVVWKNATEDCRAITAWTGSISGNVIKTRWTLVFVDDNGKLVTQKNRDTFTRK